MYDKTTKPVLINIRTVKTSPSVSRLMTAYKSYVIDSVLNANPIVDLERFYWSMRKKEEIKRSRIFEKYLRTVFGVETGLDKEDIK